MKYVEQEALIVRLWWATEIDDPREKEKHVERIAAVVQKVRAQMP